MAYLAGISMIVHRENINKASRLASSEGHNLPGFGLVYYFVFVQNKTSRVKQSQGYNFLE
jgi:hypothetical protein